MQSEIKEFTKASLPNIDSQEVHSTSTHVRMHSDEDFTEVWDYFKGFKNVLMSQEIGVNNRMHFHIIIGARLYERDKLSNQFRENLIRRFQLKGNGSYSIAAVKDADKCVSYLLKDGTYKYQGYSDDYINSRKKASYAKYSKEAFQKELSTLNEEYLMDDAGGSEQLWLDGYIKLKTRYGQYNINKNRLVDMIRSLKLRKDAKYRARFIKEIMASINLDYFQD